MFDIHLRGMVKDMKAHSLVYGFFICFCSNVLASAENLGACVTAVKQFANKTVDEFDAEFEDKFIANDVAKWPGIVCEVKLGSVQQLTVNGKRLIVDGFSGMTAKEAFSRLDQKTERAIAKLESRISLLRQRMEKAEEELKLPNPDIESISGYIESGFEKSGF